MPRELHYATSMCVDKQALPAAASNSSAARPFLIPQPNINKNHAHLMTAKRIQDEGQHEDQPGTANPSHDFVAKNMATDSARSFSDASFFGCSVRAGASRGASWRVRVPGTCVAFDQSLMRNNPCTSHVRHTYICISSVMSLWTLAEVPA